MERLQGVAGGSCVERAKRCVCEKLRRRGLGAGPGLDRDWGGWHIGGGPAVVCGLASLRSAISAEWMLRLMDVPPSNGTCRWLLMAPRFPILPTPKSLGRKST